MCYVMRSCWEPQFSIIFGRWFTFFDIGSIDGLSVVPLAFSLTLLEVPRFLPQLQVFVIDRFPCVVSCSADHCEPLLPLPLVVTAPAVSVSSCPEYRCRRLAVFCTHSSAALTLRWRESGSVPPRSDMNTLSGDGPKPRLFSISGSGALHAGYCI